MKKSYLALLAAGTVSSMFIGSSLIAADKAPEKAPAKAPEKVAEAKADAKPAVDKWAFLPEVVAEMDGKKYTKAEIIKIVDEQLAKSPFASMITPETLQQMVPRLITGMVEKDLLMKIVDEAGIKPSAELAKATVDKMLEKVSKEQLEAMKQQLAAQNKTFDGYIKEMCANEEFQKQAAYQAWMDKSILPQVKVTDKEIEASYEKNKAEFSMPEKVKTSHILISVEKEGDEAKKAAKDKAEKILADIKAGKVKFEDAAEKESACPSKKDKGSLPPFSRNDDMAPAFSKASFELKKGELSGVVETQFGFHIIRCEDKIPAQQLTLADPKVKKYISDSLRDEAAQNIVLEKLEAAKKKFNVKVFVKAPEMPVAPKKAAPAPAKK